MEGTTALYCLFSITHSEPSRTTPCTYPANSLSKKKSSARIHISTNRTVTTSKKILLSTGIALVIANMIGAGVFLSTGFMAQQIGPMAIMLAWALGAVLALAGTLTYAGVIEVLPKSGEYTNPPLPPAIHILSFIP